MSEVTMNVSLLAHTNVSAEFCDNLEYDLEAMEDVAPGQAIALSAIRTCYSPNKPSEIVNLEAEKYFFNKASDGEGGKEADRLIRHIMRSGHTSTLEHLTYTFAVEGVSRALLAQLTRHRVGFSFSVQSQRYVRFGSGDRSGGFDYVKPDSVTEEKITDSEVFDFELDNYVPETAVAIFEEFMVTAQKTYDTLRSAGVTPEDARAVLPNAAATNLVLTANLRALLDFYSKRKKGNGAQGEIAQLAEELKAAVINVEPWTESFFV